MPVFPGLTFVPAAQTPRLHPEKREGKQRANKAEELWRKKRRGKPEGEGREDVPTGTLPAVEALINAGQDRARPLRRAQDFLWTAGEACALLFLGRKHNAEESRELLF